MFCPNNRKHFQPQPDYPDASSYKLRWQNIEHAGFTLIEVVLVVAIIGILASIAFFGYGEYVERARIVSAMNDINTCVKDIRIYQIDNGDPPNNLTDIEYFDFNDPWGRPYVYIAPPVRVKADGITLLNTKFDIYSLGPDGLTDLNIALPNSLDDIIRADDDEYIGRAAGY